MTAKWQNKQFVYSTHIFAMFILSNITTKMFLQTSHAKSLGPKKCLYKF